MRTRTNAYWSASAAGLFLASYLVYIGYDAASVIVLIAALVSYPLLAFSDRVVFDGKRIARTGIVWRLFRSITGQPQRIRPRAIVHVETESIRTLRRGSNVTYLYRTSFYGSQTSFSIGSGRGYRDMIAKILPLIPESCLDVRSLELRDHYRASSLVSARARALNIPSADVLDAASILAKTGRGVRENATQFDETETTQAEELRNIANQLRTNGRLIQALEAFRRAIRVSPRNGRLIYEFARCIHSLAATKRDPKLERKAHAMLRLAERRSGGDVDLLTRLGETYFAVGSWHRAEQVFKRAAESGRAGYRIFRGLGELALRDGKIAHAINHFARSAEVATDRPLFRWANAEADYLRHLNENDEYMELEIGRINLYDSLESIRRTTVRIFCFGLFLIVTGLMTGLELIVNIGWAVSGVALLLSLSSALLKNAFASRIPFELLDKE